MSTTTLPERLDGSIERLRSIDVNQIARSYLAVHIGVIIWVSSVILIAFGDGEGTDFLSLSFGIFDITETAVIALVAGAVVSPIALVVLSLLNRIPRLSGFTKQIVLPWVFLGPVLIGVVLYTLLAPMGIGDYRLVWELIGSQLTTWGAIWLLYTTLFVAFVCGAYALSMGTITIDTRRRRAAFVAGLVVLSSVFAAGVAVPMLDDTEPDESEIDTSREPYPDVDDLRMHEYRTAGPNSAEYLVAEPPGDAPPISAITPYSVSEEHVGGEYFAFKEYVADVDGEEMTVTGQYHVELVDENGTVRNSGALVNTGAFGMDYYDDEDANTYATLSEESRATLTLAHVKSAWIYYDFVNEDGEVVRYMAYVDRGDR